MLYSAQAIAIMLDTFATTLPFFALILCGYFARWQGVMGDGSAKILNNYVLYFALPALLVRTLAGLPTNQLLEPKFIFAWTMVSSLLFALVAITSLFILSYNGAKAVVLAATGSLGNTGFLGLTLVVSVLGDTALAPVSMAIMVDLVLIIPVTIALLEYFSDRSRSPLEAFTSVTKALFANPFVLSIFLGLALSLIEFEFPKGIDDFLRILSMAAVPTALFAIGVTLYGQHLGAVWLGVATLCGLKLVVHPVAIYIVTAWLLNLPDDVVVAATLLASLPTANNAFVIAMRFNRQPDLVSSCILVSTLAAILTFNFWVLVLRM
jgi:predicted permease